MSALWSMKKLLLFFDPHDVNIRPKLETSFINSSFALHKLFMGGSVIAAESFEKMTFPARSDFHSVDHSNIGSKTSRRVDPDDLSPGERNLQSKDRKLSELWITGVGAESCAASTSLVLQQHSPIPSHAYSLQPNQPNQQVENFQPFSNGFSSSGRSQQSFGRRNYRANDCLVPSFPSATYQFGESGHHTALSNSGFCAFSSNHYRRASNQIEQHTDGRWDTYCRDSECPRKSCPSRNNFSHESTGRDSPLNRLDSTRLVPLINLVRDVGPLDIVCGRYVQSFDF